VHLYYLCPISSDPSFSLLFIGYVSLFRAKDFLNAVPEKILSSDSAGALFQLARFSLISWTS
jgi:hypothetical protein